MTETILLVEDGPDDRLFMSRAFAKAELPYSLRMVEDGQKAIDYLAGNDPYSDRSAHPLPRLVLLDLKLPNLSGFDVLRWIRAQPTLGGLSVVILSSSDHPSDVHDGYALGANSFLSKPGSPTDLTQLLREVAHYWLEKNVGGPEQG